VLFDRYIKHEKVTRVK